MATAKIATLAIRTLAKPIATQIKHQAQSHQRFRAICIGLAQFMHRTEMALRSNLLATSTTADGEKPKVRPLNEAKAVTNGANALAEGFLFALAAALIMGESYRGSRSRAKQRDRTEEGLEEIRMITQTLAEKIGVDFDEIQRKAREAQEIDRQSTEEESSAGGAKKVEGEVEEDSRTTEHESMAQTLYRQRQASEHERERLQHAVNVLLRLALKSGWIQGAEALHLEKILDGSDEHTENKEESEKREGQSIEASSMQQQQQQQQPSPILARVALLQQQRKTQ